VFFFHEQNYVNTIAQGMGQDTMCENVIQRYVFLGKGIYVHQMMQDKLVSQGGVWGHGRVAHVLPWDPHFNPDDGSESKHKRRE
jgi:hypothetical protein